MKGPFGMLLVGGGIILMVGLFTGKITFGQAAPVVTKPNTTAAGIVGATVTGSGSNKTYNCPLGMAWTPSLNGCRPVG